MSSEPNKTRAWERLRDARRQMVPLSPDALVHSAPLRDGGDLPLVISPALDGVDLKSWAVSHWREVSESLAHHGAVLFRGFDVREPAQLEDLVTATSGTPLPYLFRSTPRSTVQGRVYTSTNYPSDQSIPLHNELSYTSAWPLKVWFCCVHPSERGGETPLADSRAVLRDIDADVREEFCRRRVMYVRNFGPGTGQSLREVFQTDERAEVEEFCRRNQIEYEWMDHESLRTRQVRPALTRHPDTGEQVWFNQAHLFHVSSLPPAVREAMLSSMSEDALPRNAYFGDASPIPESTVDAVRAAYQKHEAVFPWQRGDLLLVDNVLVAHGRRPYSGERRVIVAMSEAAGDAGVDLT